MEEKAARSAKQEPKPQQSKKNKRKERREKHKQKARERSQQANENDQASVRAPALFGEVTNIGWEALDPPLSDTSLLALKRWASSKPHLYSKRQYRYF